MPYQDNINNQKKYAFDRLNSAAYELSQVSQASLMDDEPRSIHCLRNASEALSQAIELGLRFFLSRMLSSREMEYFRSSKSRMPELIRYFVDENGNPSDYYYDTLDDTIDPKVDFLFLKNNKFKLTNQAKHDGPPPDHQIALKYFEQIKIFFQQYLDEDQLIKDPEDYLKVDFGNWDLFYTASERFAQEERNYILVIGANPIVNGEHLKILSQCPWDLVIDFDYKSKENGFFFNSYKDDEIAPHQIKASDPIGSSVLSKYKQSHYHYYANNFVGSGSAAPKDFKEWNQKAAGNSAKFISTFARVFPAQKTVVVILFPEFQYINYLCQVINQHFGDSANFVIANDPDGKLDAIESYWNGTKVNISIPEIANGIRDYSSNFHFDKTIEDYDLPFLANSKTEDVTGTLSSEEFAKLEEVFEVLHLGLPDETNPENKVEFFTGSQRLGYYGLKHRFDVERSRFQHKYVKPIEKLIERGKNKVTLVHDAGFGGTTIARRIAWDIHTEYPTFILKEYRDNLVKEQLTVIHTKTRKTSFVIVEIPQSISQDEFDVLYRSISPTRPVTFLVVKRGKPGTNDLAVTDWGNDIYDLVSVYKPYLKELYSDTIRAKKERELDLLIESSDAFKKTPFYVGLLTFEESFYAINDYIKNFVAEVNGKEGQRKVLIYLSLVFDYLGQALPASFLQIFLGSDVDQFGIFRLESYFSKNSSIVESLLNHRIEGKQKYWSIKHAFFARELKKQLLSNSSLNPENWKEKLSSYCLEFIQDSSYIGENSEYIDDLLQKLFIGTRKDRSGEDFTPIIKAIPTIEEKEQVFITLKETYPANPHYASHLARFYAYNNKNFPKALDYATEAIELGHAQGLQDPLLHHIKGMVLRTTAQEKMDFQVREKRAGRPTNPDVYEDIIYNLIPSAESEFTKSREIGKADYKTDEHGYVAHIQMLIRAIDYASKMQDIPRYKLISENKQPFGEWFDLAESLLEDVKGLNRENGDNIKVNECENGIEEVYENFEVILQNLNNFLQKSPNPSRTRRQIVRTYFRKNPEYYKDSVLLQKILTLLQENLENEPESEKNFFLWFKVARHSNTSVATALSQLKIWRTKSSTVEAIFYLYILHILRAFDGYSESVVEAEKLISECKSKSRNNITIHEWFGKGKELNSIKNRHDLNDENRTEQLEYVQGVFSEFTHKGDGYITILDKLRVFFSPTQAKLTSADLNKPVKFYLGFTYDGLRADSLSVVTTGN